MQIDLMQNGYSGDYQIAKAFMQTRMHRRQAVVAMAILRSVLSEAMRLDGR